MKRLFSWRIFLSVLAGFLSLAAIIIVSRWAMGVPTRAVGVLVGLGLGGTFFGGLMALAEADYRKDAADRDSIRRSLYK